MHARNSGAQELEGRENEVGTGSTSRRRQARDTPSARPNRAGF